MLVPISDGEHHVLVAFSPPYRKILYCDSISTYRPAKNLYRRDNIYILAYFLFPFIKTDEWIFDKIHDHDSFQDADVHLDCGFHILNFAMSAIDDVQIENNLIEFAKFKRDTAKKYRIQRELVADS